MKIIEFQQEKKKQKTKKKQKKKTTKQRIKFEGELFSMIFPNVQ